MPQKISAPSVFLQLWFSRVAEATREAEAAVESILSASEKERLRSLKSAARRREYLLSRALMRHALSLRYQREPGGWDFLDQQRAKPVVNNLPEGIYLGLSHSKGLICFALANCRLGIDIELIGKQRRFTAMAKMFMNDEERSRLVAGDVDQANYFYRSWCAKEACYKLLCADEQKRTLMTAIDYARLRDGSSGWCLREGRIGQFAFAAVTASPPDSIDCEYFQQPDDGLETLELFQPA